MVRAVAERGFESVTVADVVERASVSRDTFYELFKDKKECLLAAHARVIDGLGPRLPRRRGRRPVAAEDQAGTRGLPRGVFSAEPEVARVATVEVPAAGPEAQRRYRGALERLRPLFKRAASTRRATPRRPTPS